MSTQIESFAEVRHKKTRAWELVTKKVFTGDDVKKTHKPFNWQYYGFYGFLADVRNYSESETISPPKGFPRDASSALFGEWMPEKDYSHSASHLTLEELLAFDYSKVFWDRRVEKTYSSPGGGTVTDGAARAEEGEGKKKSYKDFLGELFFTQLEEMKKLGPPADVRVVFWFDC